MIADKGNSGVVCRCFSYDPAAVVQAQFNYTTNNGTSTITGYTGTNNDVTIP